MNPTPKIPRGWRRLRKNELIQCGDKFLAYAGIWRPTHALASTPRFRPAMIYIRRVKGRK